MELFDNTVGRVTRGLGIEPSGLPVVGGLFGDPAEEQMLAALQQATDAYRQYRPELMQANMGAMQQTAGLYQPMTTAIEQMYGPGYELDFDSALQNPFPEMPNEEATPQGKSRNQRLMDRGREFGEDWLMHPYYAQGNLAKDAWDETKGGAKKVFNEVKSWF